MPIDERTELINKIKEKVDKLSFKDAEIGSMMHSLCEDYINKKKFPCLNQNHLKICFKDLKIGGIKKF